MAAPRLTGSRSKGTAVQDICISIRNGRTVWRWKHEGSLEEMKSRLESAEGWRKLLIRKELCEHPFGTMKRAFN